MLTSGGEERTLSRNAAVARRNHAVRAIPWTYVVLAGVAGAALYALANLGGGGTPAGRALELIKTGWGGYEAWEAEFAAVEARIAHGRHGDEQLAVEIAFACRAIRCASSCHGTRVQEFRCLGRGLA